MRIVILELERPVQTQLDALGFSWAPWAPAIGHTWTSQTQSDAMKSHLDIPQKYEMCMPLA